MQLPLQIVFRDVARSEAIETAIREKADKLGLFFDRIMSCRVTVGIIQKHKHQGKLFNVRVDLTVPGTEIVVNRDKAEDVYVAIRDAFDAAKRKIEEHARRMRGEVKVHELESHGQVVRLFPEQGYGFIAKADGGELYFHVYNCVHPDFDRLKVGDEVVFLEELAGEGPQANRVSIGKHKTA
ncbi:sigma 54 modulation protein / S30EA ribosomal protein [mine drainage metagenome]|uniref:Sigma 54 modulation protein / S30EA ribosomal protein n=1 Tax=mine drainage metagenome TaxID=410659 RepID=A0A1J5S9J1_9ZZZZ